MTDHFLRSIDDIREEQEARLEREMGPDMALASDFAIGALTEQQAREVRERIQKDAAFRDLVEPLLVAAEHGPRYEPMAREQVEGKWLELRRRIGLPDLSSDAVRDPSMQKLRDTIKRARARTRRAWAIGMAATIIVALLPLLYGGYQSDVHSNSQWGATQAFTLPDGSQVALAGRSEITRSQFGMQRNWKLRGEGTFEVKHAGGVAFVVETESAFITVTGTRFTVHAYRGEPTIVSVAEGSVRVSVKDLDGHATGALNLSPGQTARVTRGIRAELIP